MVLMQLEPILEKLFGVFGNQKIQSFVVSCFSSSASHHLKFAQIFGIELVKGLSRLHILFTKQECAAMLIKWGRVNLSHSF
jgi:hypothetical protein